MSQKLTGTSYSSVLLKRWQTLVDDLKQAQPITIQQSYSNDVNGEVKSTQLYEFCDASNKAYAAVVYLVVETASGVCMTLLCSPIQHQTIPRLKLLSEILLARLISNTTDALSSQKMMLNPPRCFTDSQVALFWICGLKREWKPLVQNWANEIRRLTQVDCWSHCLGKENPADVPSRGLTPLELSVNMMWRHGLEWLNKGEDIEDHEDCVAEMKPTDLGQIMSCEKFSTLSHLLKVTTYVIKSERVLQEEGPEHRDELRLFSTVV